MSFRQLRVRSSTGRVGKTVRLLSAIADDEGKGACRAGEAKRQGGEDDPQPGAVVAKSPKAVATRGRLLAKPMGSYQHCVVAIDASGNKSPESCAKIVLK